MGGEKNRVLLLNKIEVKSELQIREKEKPKSRNQIKMQIVWALRENTKFCCLILSSLDVVCWLRKFLSIFFFAYETRSLDGLRILICSLNTQILFLLLYKCIFLLCDTQSNTNARGRCNFKNEGPFFSINVSLSCRFKKIILGLPNPNIIRLHIELQCNPC